MSIETVTAVVHMATILVSAFSLALSWQTVKRLRR